MSGATMLVGLGATRAGWSGELRGFLRDHMVGLTAVTVLDGRQLLREGQRRFDVVLVDDETRMFGPVEVGRVVAAGTLVIGLYGTEGGLGREYLERLGVSRLLPVGVPVGELARVIGEIGPTIPPPVPPSRLAANGTSGAAGRRGALTVLSAVSGGVGMTETMVGLGDEMADGRRVLVVEANPLSATLAARLRRDPGYGLAWVLGRVAHGYPALPDGLTPPHPDVGPALGRFDVICQTARPGGPASADPAVLGVLIDEALGSYDHVLVEVGPVLSSPEGGGTADRFAAGRVMAARADRVVVFGAADPEAAARLVEWRAAVAELDGPEAAWAVFGRVPARGLFEWSHLRQVVEDGTGRSGFVAIHRLPEDRVVARARWNGELVWRGRWRSAVRALAGELIQPVPVRPASDLGVAVPAGASSLAGEAGW